MFESLLYDLLLVLCQEIIQASRNAGQEASGRTYEQILPDVFSEGNKTIGEVTAPVYFGTLIRGRGPGPIPEDMVEIIKEWAAYKGITFESIDDMNRFARAVAYTIKREGSELYRNHLYIDIADTPIRNFEAALQERLNGEVEAMIIRSLNADSMANHGFII